MSRKRIAYTLGIGFGLTLAGLPALAQDATIGVVPRVWFTNENISFYPDEINPSRVVEEINLPLAGLTLSFTPNWDAESPLAGTSFFATGLYGTADGNWQSATHAGTYEVERIDAELLARTPMANSKVSLYWGGRWINFSQSETVNAVFPITGTANREHTMNYLLGEAGLGIADSFGESGRHWFFANMVGGVGLYDSQIENRVRPGGGIPDRSGVVWSVDINAGYQYSFDFGSVFARYRAFRPSETREVDVDNPIIHGPEVGLQIRF